MAKKTRVCTNCHRVFEFDYPGVGRPRSICLGCQPEGFKLERARHYVVLRKLQSTTKGK